MVLKAAVQVSVIGCASKSFRDAEGLKDMPEMCLCICCTTRVAAVTSMQMAFIHHFKLGWVQRLLQLSAPQPVFRPVYPPAYIQEGNAWHKDNLLIDSDWGPVKL